MSDLRAKATVVDYLHRQGVYCQPAEDKYGAGIAVYTGLRHKYFIDYTVYLGWATGHYSNQSVNIPVSKLQYIRGTTKDVQFWLLSEDLQYAVIIDDHIVSSSNIVSIPTSTPGQDEQFISVPIEQCMLVNLVGE